MGWVTHVHTVTTWAHSVGGACAARPICWADKHAGTAEAASALAALLAVLVALSQAGAERRRRAKNNLDFVSAVESALSQADNWMHDGRSGRRTYEPEELKRVVEISALYELLQESFAVWPSIRLYNALSAVRVAMEQYLRAPPNWAQVNETLSDDNQAAYDARVSDCWRVCSKMSSAYAFSTGWRAATGHIYWTTRARVWRALKRAQRGH